MDDSFQFRFRSGTRAGFIRKIYRSPQDAETEHVAVGKKAIENASASHPAYLVEIEKNGSYYVKTADQLSKVKGETGMSESEIKSHDRNIKERKTRGKQTAAEAEPLANSSTKKRVAAGKAKPNKRPRRAK